jgi:uncharacterized protein with gpF-like domain
MPAQEGRVVVRMLCKSRKAHHLEASRNKLQEGFHNSLVRVLDFAKHETLRKVHRHLYTHRPLMGQEESDHPDSARVAFDAAALGQDLDSMLQSELPTILDAGAQDTLNAVGYRDPWKLPAQDTLNFIANRQNLLSGVPDEIYQQIQSELTDGLNAGETTAQLSQRIQNAFDEISKGRADVIAATETAAAYGYSSHLAALQAGIEYKKWLHSVISKEPRPDHLEIDGLVIPIDELYPVGDPRLMYPHAPDGSAEDVINCRCISVPASRADFERQQ